MKTSTALCAALALAGIAFASGYALGRRPALPGETGTREDDSPAVATFSGGKLTAAELKARIDEQGPLLKRQYASAEARKQLAREAVRQKLLAGEARARGYARTPEVSSVCERALVDQYVRKELEQPESARSVTDEELKGYFEQHQQEYARPEQFRVAHLFLAAPASGPEREKKAAQAQALLREVKDKSARDYYAFATLARERSEDAATRMTREELEQRLGTEATKVVLALRGNDVLADQVLETPQGFHLLKLRGREDAMNPDFATLKNVLRTHYLAERRTQEHDKRLRELEERAQVRFDDEALAGLGLDTSDGAGQPQSGGKR
jgi:peptidyl-prolyl cis-trans isomerase C